MYIYSVPYYILPQRVPCCIVKLSHEPFKDKYLKSSQITTTHIFNLFIRKEMTFRLNTGVHLYTFRIPKKMLITIPARDKKYSYVTHGLSMYLKILLPLKVNSRP